MLLTLLQFFATKFLFLALHLESGCFPRPLTAREEAAAFSALRAGDAAAREKLIRHNLRLVAHIVKKYYALPGDQEDLVSIGTIGLMKAVDTFDATRKARFSTYASRCIENEIRMQFRRERKNGQTVSLQEALEADGDSALTLADVIQDGFCMEDSCERQEDVRRLRQLLDTLPARERQILLLRYGLAGQPPLTQLETAGLLGISRSYVSRLETHALELLCRRGAKTASFHSCKIFNCNSSSCSKVYRRLKVSTSSFLERRGGSPSAFKSLALRSALPGLPESPHSYRSV